MQYRQRREGFPIKIIRQIHSDTENTKVCSCEEFQSTTCGLGIAWRLREISKFQVDEKSTIMYEEDSKRRIEEIHLAAYKSSEFTRRFTQLAPSLLQVSGVYNEGTAITISFHFNSREISISHGKSEKDMTAVAVFLSNLASLIQDTFRLLIPIPEAKTEMLGSQYFDIYACRFFENNSIGLGLSVIPSLIPGAIFKWISVYRDGVAPSTEEYGRYTEKVKISAKDMVIKYENMAIAQTRTLVRWQGHSITIICDFKKHRIMLIWDKWLGASLYQQFVRELNSQIYETFFG